MQPDPDRPPDAAARTPGASSSRPGALSVKRGSVIGDKYRVVAELGRGGFGIVVRALHLTLDQVVAIKILLPGEGGDAEWQEDAARFHREGRATAALQSEHVVRILDVDVLPDGSPYMVMEHLEGVTLHDAIHTRAMIVLEVVDHAIEVCAALGAAHAAGIVHRDLKPANVFITHGPGGAPVVKVLDFGVSKVAGGTVSAMTRTGAVLGTVAYMAPEQLLDAKRVDARADLWSVGVILYEALSRKLPFGAVNAPGLVDAIMKAAPAPLSSHRPDVDPAFEAVVMRCLSRDPAARFATASELAAALAPFASTRSRTALEALRFTGPPRGAASPAQAPGKRAGSGPSGPAKGRPILLFALVFVLLFALASMATFLLIRQ